MRVERGWFYRFWELRGRGVFSGGLCLGRNVFFSSREFLIYNFFRILLFSVIYFVFSLNNGLVSGRFVYWLMLKFVNIMYIDGKGFWRMKGEVLFYSVFDIIYIFCSVLDIGLEVFIVYYSLIWSYIV